MIKAARFLHWGLIATAFSAAALFVTAVILFPQEREFSVGCFAAVALAGVLLRRILQELEELLKQHFPRPPGTRKPNPSATAGGVLFDGEVLKAYNFANSQ